MIVTVIVSVTVRVNVRVTLRVTVTVETVTLTVLSLYNTRPQDITINNISRPPAHLLQRSLECLCLASQESRCRTTRCSAEGSNPMTRRLPPASEGCRREATRRKNQREEKNAKKLMKNKTRPTVELGDEEWIQITWDCRRDNQKEISDGLCLLRYKEKQ